MLKASLLDAGVSPLAAGLERVVRFGLYPALWVWLLACLGYGLSRPEDLARVVAVNGGVTFGILLLAEWRFPYQRRWGMT
jgi:hypothetical protein